MLLPSGRTVQPTTPIYPTSNFTWSEATKKCTRHIQELVIGDKIIINAHQIEAKIVETARELDICRSILGDRPLWVNSWYRPPHINARVGGARYSRHLFGDGVDIRSDYLSSAQIYRLLDKVHVEGGLGRYHSFVHIDWRGEIARWRG